jgi:hypothetical protein
MVEKWRGIQNRQGGKKGNYVRDTGVTNAEKGRNLKRMTTGEGEWRPEMGPFLGGQIVVAVRHVGRTRGAARFGSRDGLQMRSKLLCRCAKLNGLTGDIIQSEKFSHLQNLESYTLSSTHFHGQTIIGRTMDRRRMKEPQVLHSDLSFIKFSLSESLPCRVSSRVTRPSMTIMGLPK